MPARTIAIGDIHGCLKALDGVLDAIQPQPQDQIVTLGDHIDRGPDSRGVIERLLELQTRCTVVPLMGNHEQMFLWTYDDEAKMPFWLECGGWQCLESYGGSLDDVPPEHVEFLRSCRRYFETPTHFFIHANYDPELPLDLQPDFLAYWEHIDHMRPGPHCSGKIAVVGHTPQLAGNVLDLGHLICLDTGCFARGWLTALDVETGEIWQADKRGGFRL